MTRLITRVLEPSFEAEWRQMLERRRVDNLAKCRFDRIEAWRSRALKSFARSPTLTTSPDMTIDRISIDPSVVRGLEYYTGPVYEVELLLETKDEKGRPVRFGSVGGGGRYDGLVSRFRGEPVPATGFSIGVSRLAGGADRCSASSTTSPRPARWWSRCSTATERRRLSEDGRGAAQRRHPRRAVSRQSEAQLGQQLKYADKRGSPCAVIQGGDEKAKGEVQIKDLIARRRAQRPSRTATNI